jgi:hypothetical protein
VAILYKMATKGPVCTYDIFQYPKQKVAHQLKKWRDDFKFSAFINQLGYISSPLYIESTPKYQTPPKCLLTPNSAFMPTILQTIILHYHTYPHFHILQHQNYSTHSSKSHDCACVTDISACRSFRESSLSTSRRARARGTHGRICRRCSFC